MRLTVQRQAGATSRPYVEDFSYEGDPHVSVLNVLEYVNLHPEARISGDGPFRPISYEESCEQGLCGACAMVVNGIPRLACQSFCDEVAGGDGVVRVGPLAKFPVVCDLVVDRSELGEAVQRMRAWVEGEAKVRGDASSQYEAALCLQCGCCLEACPNYAAGGLFGGALAAVNSMNMLCKGDGGPHAREMAKAYGDGFFATCSKNGACERVCPVGLPIMTITSEANRVSVWRFWQLLGHGRG